MVFRCPNCKRGLSVDEGRWAGKRIRLKCPGCGNRHVVEVPGIPSARGAESTVPLASGDSRGGEREEARRIARLIIQEIRMYHEKHLDGMTRKREILGRLRKEIAQGKRHYLSRVSSDLPGREEIFNQVVKEVLLRGKS